MNDVRQREGWTRREAVGGLGALLAAGLWPGTLRASEATAQPRDDGAGGFDFVVANDFHHDSAACDAWFARLFRQIAATGGGTFCAALGDFANRGKPESLAAVRDAAAAAGVRLYPVPGNHDNDVEETTRLYAEVFPGRLNYAWTHGGWQFLALDTTDGKRWGETTIAAETLAWLDATVPKLDTGRPTVLVTHFPLTPVRNLTPRNAEDVLARLATLNLRGVFSGHFHGRTEVRRGDVDLVTGACCSRVAGNHDGTTVKGYWRCRASGRGRLTREFVEFRGDAGV